MLLPKMEEPEKKGKIMPFKEYKIDVFGDKQKKLKRAGQVIEFDYFSQSAFDRQNGAHICGYTNLKPPKMKTKKEPSGILMYNNIEVSYVYAKPPMFSTVKGYAKIRQTNEFVAIVTYRNYLLALMFLLLILLALLIPCCNKDTDSTTNTDPWIPTIESSIGEDETGTTRPRNTEIEIAGFSAWHIDAGKTKNIPITLKNPEGNPCYFPFSIILSDGETIYQSDMVPPGESIKKITINRALDIGSYNATVRIDTNALEDGEPMNKAEMNIVIIVS